MRPAGGRRRFVRRQAAAGRCAGRSGHLPRRDPRIHQDGPRYSRGQISPPSCSTGATQRIQLMNTLTTGPWSQLGTKASRVRTAVFVDEQNIPAELEWDEADAEAVHVVVCNPLGEPVATGRLLVHAPGVGRIGRMAVLSGLRGRGLGQQVLEALVQAARERGDAEVCLHAQTSAQGFYERLGFTPRGDVYAEVGIPHIEMFSDIRQ
ncbi:MAG: GNAT family N-acetyltransferase [Ferruginibacter sp.]|nr:GNAT family N-acetyltransferase [Rhodoferax sp.]